RARTAAAPDGLTLGSRQLPGPLWVVVAWDDYPYTFDEETLLLTTRPPPDEPGRTVLGPAELSALLDERPDVRRRVPFVLGARDLDGLIPGPALERSTGDVTAARELARVFVPTRAYERTLAVLQRTGFAVVTGPPEMGKTAIARMLGLALLTEGWELHECIRPDELWSSFARDRPQVFVADDAFGSTEYRPDAAEHWALELDRVLRAL